MPFEDPNCMLGFKLWILSKMALNMLCIIKQLWEVGWIIGKIPFSTGKIISWCTRPAQILFRFSVSD